LTSAPLALATFEPLIGATFDVEVSAGVSVSLTLRSAEPAPGGRGFSLLFAGPDPVPLAQGTYRFTHASLGMNPIFLVPVAREPGVFVYEAVFT
jgi:hypothetical protein